MKHRKELEVGDRIVRSYVINFNTPEPRSIEAYRGKITWRDDKQMEVLTDAGELKETRITAGETKLVTKAGDNDE